MNNSTGSSYLHIILLGTLYYLSLLVMIRLTGKRMLSDMNAFDVIVNIAIGSILATVITDPTIPFLRGLVLLAVLIVLQFIVAFLSSRIDTFSKVIKAEPAILYYEGEYMRSVLRKERITQEEVQQAVRNAGYGSMDEVSAVILESNGSLSVLTGTGDLLDAGAYQQDRRSGRL